MSGNFGTITATLRTRMKKYRQQTVRSKRTNRTCPITQSINQSSISPAKAYELAKKLNEQFVDDDDPCSPSGDVGVQDINNDVAKLVEGFVHEINNLPVQQVTETDQQALLTKCLMGLKPLLVSSPQSEEFALATVVRMSRQLHCKKITFTSKKMKIMLDGLTEATSPREGGLTEAASPLTQTRNGQMQELTVPEAPMTPARQLRNLTKCILTPMEERCVICHDRCHRSFMPCGARVHRKCLQEWMNGNQTGSVVKAPRTRGSSQVLLENTHSCPACRKRFESHRILVKDEPPIGSSCPG